MGQRAWGFGVNMAAPECLGFRGLGFGAVGFKAFKVWGVGFRAFGL